jgi:prepilin-type processing-associated H-X9-DG protein
VSRLANRLKARLLGGEKVAAIWIELESPTMVEAAVHAGWGTVLIDTEHGWIGAETLVHMLRACEAAGGDAILRVPDAAPATIKRALDLGVQSLMVPMVSSVEAAEALVREALYPPRGGRGYAAPIVRASRYGAHPDYAAWAHEELLLIAQIEQAEAVEAAAGIAAVEGIDMLFVGPNDLAGSMGLLERLDHPDLLAAVARVEAAARASGALLGTIPHGGRDAAALFADGHAFCACASDVGLLREGAAAALRTTRG